MKHVKAQAVFPQSLLDEIQKYVQGELVYIPKVPGTYKQWGANTNAKKLVAQRNKDMVQAFKTGATIAQLAALHFLSQETVKKIVYGK